MSKELTLHRKIHGVSLQDRHIEGQRLEESILLQAITSGVNISEIEVVRADIAACFFLPNSDIIHNGMNNHMYLSFLSKSFIYNTYIGNTTITGSIFNECIFVNTFFYKCAFNTSTFRRCSFSGCSFDQCTFVETKLTDNAFRSGMLLLGQKRGYGPANKYTRSVYNYITHPYDVSLPRLKSVPRWLKIVSPGQMRRRQGRYARTLLQVAGRENTLKIEELPSQRQEPFVVRPPKTNKSAARLMTKGV